MEKLFRVFWYLFILFLVLFLAGGLGVVALQAFGVLTKNGALAVWAQESLGPWVFAAATSAALCAFVFLYRPDASKSTKESD